MSEGNLHRNVPRTRGRQPSKLVVVVRPHGLVCRLEQNSQPANAVALDMWYNLAKMWFGEGSLPAR